MVKDTDGESSRLPFTLETVATSAEPRSPLPPVRSCAIFPPLLELPQATWRAEQPPLAAETLAGLLQEYVASATLTGWRRGP